MKLQGSKIHRILFLFSIVLLMVGIPFCRPFMSIGVALLTLNWVVEGKFSKKWEAIRSNKILWSVLLLFLIHLIGLIYTKNWNYAINDLRIKIPLLLIPLVLSSTPSISKKEFCGLLKIYLFSVCTSTAIGLIHFLLSPELTDKREIAYFISYIRFELNLCFGLVIAFYFLKNNIKEKKNLIALDSAAIIWISAIMLYVGAMTAISITCFLIVIWLIISGFRSKSKIFKWNFICMGCLCCAIVITILSISWKNYSVAKYNAETAETLTAKGNPYEYPFEKEYIENGEYVFSYVCEKELKEAWNKRSKLNYEENSELKNILIRYLNSKGLRKDEAGVEALSDTDIKNIENGIANVKYSYGGFSYRYYETLWQMSMYLKFKQSVGSVPQRFDTWKYSIKIISEYPLIGVGSGDVKDVFVKAMEENHRNSEKKLVRSHNQYLSFGIAFGLVGLAIIIFSFIYPPVASGKIREPIYLAFTLIILISMLTDDTLERQDGVTLFATFNSMFLFLWPEKEKNKCTKSNNKKSNIL